MASPFVIEAPAHEDELIKPALQGTLSVMRACHANKVRRVSITSSVVAINSSDPATQPEVLDETAWSDVNYARIGAYEKSKTLAEREAWDFVQNLPEHERFELTTINPSLIIGPSLIKTDFASGKILNMFMRNEVPCGIPVICMALVDVRDVAQAHLNCLEIDEAQGKRSILCAESLWMREIAAILRENFGQYGYPIPNSEACYCCIKMASYLRDDAAKIASLWGHELRFNNPCSREVLGIDYRPIKDSLKEMVESMIDLGLLEERRTKDSK